MMNELIQSSDMADNDDNIRAIMVTVAGSAFYAGAELKGLFDRRRAEVEHLKNENRSEWCIIPGYMAFSS